MVSLPESESKDKDYSNDDIGRSPYQYEYAHTNPIIEKPKRAATVLRNIAIAHGFELHGRDYITGEDLPILAKIVLSSANRERISVVKALLLAPKGISGLIPSQIDTTRDVDVERLISTSYLIAKTGISKSQIHRIVTELEVLGLVDIYKAGSSHQNHIVFKREFDWVYEKDFQDLLKKCHPSKSDTTEGEQT